MSASLLSGNAALGPSASSPRSAGAKAPAPGSTDDSSFQLAVGSAGGQSRGAAQRHPGQDVGETVVAATQPAEPAPRQALADEPAPRLHSWILGIDANPAAGDLLLTGGALTPEQGNLNVRVDTPATGSEEGLEQTRPRLDEKAQRLAMDETASAVLPSDAEDTGSGTTETPRIAALKTSLVDAEPISVEPDHTGEKNQHSAEQPEPAPVENGGASRSTVAGHDSTVGPAIAELAANTGPDRQPETADQPVHPAKAAIDTMPPPAPAQEPIAADKRDPAQDLRTPQPDAKGHPTQPLAALAGQAVTIASRPAVTGSKVTIARDDGRALDVAGRDAFGKAADEVGKQERPRLDAVGRNPPANDPVGGRQPREQRSSPVDARSASLTARDPSGGQPAPTAQSPVVPTNQAPAVTVIEARQFPGIAPQQANTEAIVRAASGNEVWSAVLRNETSAQTNAQLQTLKIRLNPAELGMVDATLRLAGDRLVVELNVETVEAYRQLSESRQTVLNAMRGQGYGVEQISVQLSAPDRGGQQGTSSGQQQGGFDGQLAQDNSRQSGEGGRFGQENGNGDDRGSENTARRDTPAGETPALPGGVAADGSVYL